MLLSVETHNAITLTSTETVDRNQVGVHEDTATGGLPDSMLCQIIHCISLRTITGRTDLVPLALAVVVLEKTLVERDTVLAEHEPMNERNELARFIN